MAIALSAFDIRLLNEFQRNVPIVSRPFKRIAHLLGSDEDTVLARIAALKEAGIVSRFGATLRPNTAGASTLAAMAVSNLEVDRVAEIIDAEPGVNHSYLREHDLNLWFVATGPDRRAVDDSLRRIAFHAGTPVLDFPLVRPFNIDLGFDLNRGGVALKPAPEPITHALSARDRQILQRLSNGLALSRRPFKDLSGACSASEHFLIQSVRRLVEAGFISRFGVIVRHRALGWRANAMIVWQVPLSGIGEAGAALAELPGITLCYQRRPVPGKWPYTLYSMIHAKSRDAALSVLENARALPQLSGVQHEVLFSLRCFKQTGAMVAHEPEEQPA